MHFRSRAGFTLLEVATVIVIITILFVMLVPAFDKYRERAERLGCTTNLRSLYTAASGYLVDNSHWPQIRNTETNDEEYADEWNKALSKYGIGPTNWLCPSVQRKSAFPDVTKKEHIRIDYFATPFDDHPSTPHKWPNQPWFIERADMHGTGHLILFPDGAIVDYRQAVKRAGSMNR
jgi:prepilin-type N-terminal cleavage/methylation domain-containing protein